ncbi:sugar ABC transporter ATP-binding protein [Capillimicrobium parvum]|uniref:Arabinose import ATP-binding protein AraG n=1 Tax=Capillimicrobium parvum TaxID=2884022 RepID=A0A9E6Y2C4_9ACTN|nr:sugar ABC transporter ATP-binding protein [Capillimicrobium parvum]UGS38303.1 Arabinose import ATP-binding protein AraG [Capillimicrobium parvum]
MSVVTSESTVGGPAAGLPPAVVVEDLVKTYPGTRALKGVSLSVRSGEFRALVGENGSGKSTLVGILGGKTVADPGGRVEIFGQPLVQGNPSKAADAGVAVIHQELLMVPQLSAMENVFLGDLPARGSVVSRRRMRREYNELAERGGIDVPADALVSGLSVAQQAMLEILRALRREARLVIMDEPTVTLGVPEREKLYAIVAGMRRQGVTFVLVSHDLEEVMGLADSVTVFRDGSLVRTAPKEAWTKERLVVAMLGDERAGTLSQGIGGGPISKESPELDARTGHTSTGPPRSREFRAPLLRVRGVRAGAKVRIDEIEVAAGEIVGLAGLVGSGRTSVLRAIAGDFPGSTGHMELESQAVAWPKSVSAALDRGVALLPEDRKTRGLVLDMPVYDNVTLSDLSAVSRGGTLRRSRSWSRASGLLASVEFRGAVGGPVRTLSGGNQQKVMVAKWLHRAPRVLLIDEPTRGIDIGAKQDIMRVLNDLADLGHAILWVSSEFEEVIAVSHRVLLISKGRCVAELSGNEMTLDRVLAGVFEADFESQRHSKSESAQ